MKRRSRSAAIGATIFVTSLLAVSASYANEDNAEDISIQDEIEELQKAGTPLDVLLDPNTGEPVSYEVREYPATDNGGRFTTEKIIEDISIQDEIEAFQRAGFSLDIVLDPITGEPVSYVVGDHTPVNESNSAIRGEIEALQKAGAFLDIVLDPDNGEPVSYKKRELPIQPMTTHPACVSTGDVLSCWKASTSMGSFAWVGFSTIGGTSGTWVSRTYYEQWWEKGTICWDSISTGLLTCHPGWIGAGARVSVGNQVVVGRVVTLAYM